MTQPTNSIDSELREVLNKVYAEAYKCGVGAKHPYRYRSIEAVVAEALQAIKTLYISRKEVEEAINEVEKPSLGLRVIFRSAVFYELRAKLLPPTKGGSDE